MNKRGSLVLRDIMFMLLAFAGIIVFASIFATEMAISYGNTDMQGEFEGSKFYSTSGEAWLDTKNSTDYMQNKTKGGLGSVVGTFLTAKDILEKIFFAPDTFSDMIVSILDGYGANETVLEYLGIMITSAIYLVIIFVIISAFLQGGKL